MQKLKNRVIDKMMSLRLTKAEVDFLIEISHYQDDTGRIYGVYYKDICKAIGVSSQTFYVTIYGLADKGLISLKKAFYSDWDIIINENDFSYPEALQEGYISTGHDMFYNKKFRALKANEKLLALQFLKIGGAGKRYHIGVNVFYDKFSKILQVSKRTIQVYLGKLKAFFSIGIKNKMYWITPLVAVYKNNAPRDMHNLSNHLGRVACRRNRVSYTAKGFKETTDLISQYSQELGIKTAKVFLKAVNDSIRKVNETIRDKRRWNRQLNPKFVHMLIKKTI